MPYARSTAPSYQAGRTSATPCDRLAKAHYNTMFGVCDEHADAIRTGEGEDMADEAVSYLKRWLWMARQKANHWLEVVLEDALLEARHRLLKAQQESARRVSGRPPGDGRENRKREGCLRPSPLRAYAGPAAGG